MEIIDRFKDAKWFAQKKEIIIGGAGGIGSPLIFLLSAYGHELHVYDFDKVELVNCGTQMYEASSVGKYKTKALRELLGRFGNSLKYFSYEERYKESTMTTDIVISCFDNMKARKDMFNNWKNNPTRELFIDGRLLAEHFQVFVVKGDDEKQIENYEQEYLFSDSEVEPAPCTYKQTRHIAFMISSYMTQMLCNHLRNIEEGIKISELPFLTSYNAIQNHWEYV